MFLWLKNTFRRQTEARNLPIPVFHQVNVSLSKWLFWMSCHSFHPERRIGTCLLLFSFLSCFTFYPQTISEAVKSHQPAAPRQAPSGLHKTHQVSHLCLQTAECRSGPSLAAVMLHAAQRGSFDHDRVLHQFGLQLHALPCYFKQHRTSHVHFPPTPLRNPYNTTRSFDSSEVNHFTHVEKRSLSVFSIPETLQIPGWCLFCERCSALSGFVFFFLTPAVELNSQSVVLKWTLCVSWLCSWDVEAESRRVSSACLSVCLRLYCETLTLQLCTWRGAKIGVEAVKGNEGQTHHDWLDDFYLDWIPVLWFAKHKKTSRFVFLKQKDLLDWVKVHNFFKICLDGCVHTFWGVIPWMNKTHSFFSLLEEKTLKLSYWFLLHSGETETCSLL